MPTIHETYSEAHSRPSDKRQAQVDAVIAENIERKRAMREKLAIKRVYRNQLERVIEALQVAARTNTLFGGSDEASLMGMIVQAKHLLSKAA